MVFIAQYSVPALAVISKVMQMILINQITYVDTIYIIHKTLRTHHSNQILIINCSTKECRYLIETCVQLVHTDKNICI